jgi:hypothetical protein
MRNVLIGTFVLVFSIPAIADNWYRLSTKSGPMVYDWYGTMKESKEEIIKKMNSDEILEMNSLLFFDQQNRIKPWSDWQPSIKDTVYIRANDIITFQEMKGDPRTQ